VGKGSEKIKKAKENGRKGKEIIKVKGRRKLTRVIGLIFEFAPALFRFFRRFSRENGQ